MIVGNLVDVVNALADPTAIVTNKAHNCTADEAMYVSQYPNII